MAITLRNESDSQPRLEYYPINSPTLRTIIIEEFPFIIGRGESAQLQIKLESISREHAQLTKTSSGYRLRDLNSTNGTAINGQPISDAILEDGDAISIAETELTFLTSAIGELERMVTQPLADKRKIDPQFEFANNLWASRELNEALLWQAIPLCRTSVLDCPSKTDHATIVSIDEPLASRLQSTDAHDDCSTATRIQQLAWQLTAIHADEISSVDSILMRVELHSGLDNRLCDAWEQAVDCLTSRQSLGIILPWEWAVQSPATLAICAQLKVLGAELAFDDFSGGATCVGEMKLASPDLLVLAPTLVRGISSHPRRREQLRNVVSLCEAADIRVVLPVGLTEQDRQTAHEFGLNLVLSNPSTPLDVISSYAIPISV